MELSHTTLRLIFFFLSAHNGTLHGTLHGTLRGTLQGTLQGTLHANQTVIMFVVLALTH